MRLSAILIVSLLALVIAAPIVDAIACEDCRDVISLRVVEPSPENGANHYEGDLSSSEAGLPATQESDAAEDLCPVCANMAAAMGNACCDAPSLVGQKNPLPKLIAVSVLSYPINKPPQF